MERAHTGGPAPAGPPCAPATGRGTRECHDGLEAYCRSLGHYVRFGYCRAAGGELPCARVTECWAGRIPVEEYLREHYTPQELTRAFAPKPGKLETILEIVQRLTGSRQSP